MNEIFNIIFKLNTRIIHILIKLLKYLGQFALLDSLKNIKFLLIFERIFGK